MRRANRTMVWLGLGVAALLTVAYAAERLDFPGDFAGPPLYGVVVDSADDGWVAYAFYHDPDGIPGGANLIDVDPAARGVALTVHGYVIRSDPPPAPPDVFHVENNEDMPVWLVSFDDYEDAAADGVVTIGELEAAASLIRGTADQYVLNQSTKGANTYATSGNGPLEDGRSFKFLGVWQDDTLNVNVTVK